MNVIQLKIKLASINLERTADDRVSATGTCQFQFSDRGSLQVRSLPYHAWGQAALTMQEAGIGSIHAISGQFHVFPPKEQQRNPVLLLSVTNALPLTLPQPPSTKAAGNGRSGTAARQGKSPALTEGAPKAIAVRR
jgi:hypothetical protein